MIEKGLFITIFTDASFCPDTKASGWAVWIKYGENGTVVKHKGGYIAGGYEHSYNAEKFALEMSVDMCRLLKEHNRMVLKDKIVVIESDCQGALNSLDTSVLTNLGVSYVKRKWVKAHTNRNDKRSVVNNWCDVTAYAEMKKLRHKKKKVREKLRAERRKIHEENRARNLKNKKDGELH
jgi:hypothetical protein